MNDENENLKSDEAESEVRFEQRVMPPFYPNKSSLIIYDEDGYTIQGEPSQSIEGIEKESERWKTICKGNKKAMKNHELEFFKRQYEIEHPIETLWDKFICWLRSA